MALDDDDDDVFPGSAQPGNQVPCTPVRELYGSAHQMREPKIKSIQTKLVKEIPITASPYTHRADPCGHDLHGRLRAAPRRT